MIDPVLKKASSSRRFRATTIDFLLMIAAGLLIFLPTVVYSFVYNLDVINRNFPLLVTISVLSSAIYVVWLMFYSVVLPYKWNGQTIGRRIYSIRIVKKNGEKVTFWTLFYRESMRTILFILTLGLSMIIDFVIILVGNKKISYYDVLASTRVIDA